MIDTDGTWSALIAFSIDGISHLNVELISSETCGHNLDTVSFMISLMNDDLTPLSSCSLQKSGK